LLVPDLDLPLAFAAANFAAFRTPIEQPRRAVPVNPSAVWQGLPKAIVAGAGRESAEPEPMAALAPQIPFLCFEKTATLPRARSRHQRAGFRVFGSWLVTPRRKLSERAARCGSKPKRRVVQVRRAASVRLCEIPGRRQCKPAWQASWARIARPISHGRTERLRCAANNLDWPCCSPSRVDNPSKEIRSKAR
jgi:hypothetical protein